MENIFEFGSSMGTAIVYLISVVANLLIAVSYADGVYLQKGTGVSASDWEEETGGKLHGSTFFVVHILGLCGVAVMMHFSWWFIFMQVFLWLFLMFFSFTTQSESREYVSEAYQNANDIDEIITDFTAICELLAHSRTTCLSRVLAEWVDFEDCFSGLHWEGEIWLEEHELEDDSESCSRLMCHTDVILDGDSGADICTLSELAEFLNSGDKPYRSRRLSDYENAVASFSEICYLLAESGLTCSGSVIADYTGEKERTIMTFKWKETLSILRPGADGYSDDDYEERSFTQSDVIQDCAGDSHVESREQLESLLDSRR